LHDYVRESLEDFADEFTLELGLMWAEAIMDVGKAQECRLTDEWLMRGQDILLAAGQNMAWRVYINGLMDKHQQKYLHMPMLREL
jgi:uncharacterized Zn finger protein